MGIKDVVKNSPLFMANKRAADAGMEAMKYFNEVESKNPGKISEELLLGIINDNKDTEYGKKYDFANIKSIKDYQKKVPIITYADIDDYIERMAEGEKNVLTAYPFDHMNETSGTVGKKKKVPLTDRQQAVYLKYNRQMCDALMSQKLDQKYMEGRAFCTSEGNLHRSKVGITIGCASAKMAECIQGGNKVVAEMFKMMFTSPIEATAPGPGSNTKYLHTRFALMDKDLTGIVCGFYGNLVHLMTYIAENYELLIKDIENGTIDESIELPDDARASLKEKIKPMPERAAELKKLFAKGSDFPFMRRVWPKLTYISGVGGDGFSCYDELLKNRFYEGHIDNVYAGITASEGLWSIPFELNNKDSVLAPGAAFMEFQPVENGDDFSDIKTIDELEQGKVYELVITNLAGFYRYRMSDAVMVTGKYNETPTVQFMYRVNKTININCEKTTEFALRKACEDTAKELDFDLDDYCIYPNTDIVPGRYEFYIETRSDKRFTITQDELADCLLKHLCEANKEYQECYEEDLLGKLTAKFLQPETHMLYRDLAIMKGASPSQLKPVRVIGDEQQRKFFERLVEE